MGLIAGDDFSMKIRVSCQLLQKPFSKHALLSMVVHGDLTKDTELTAINMEDEAT